MPGHNKTGFEQADDFGGLAGRETASAAHRDQRHINRPQCVDHRLVGYMIQVAHVSNNQVVVVKDVHHVAPGLFLRLIERGHADDKHPADFIFARPADHMLVSLNRRQIIVTGGVVADRHDVSFQARNLVSQDFVIRVGDNRHLPAISYPKATMPIPDNIHNAEDLILGVVSDENYTVISGSAPIIPAEKRTWVLVKTLYMV
jgi:hypothetical protein